ncbi:DUF2306 domain-containing protein [Streptosporangium subroseum]|uniref:DUF2306 domain-containing protein n=1 Tax=Streptosporangium subroseum TaxID=106412 RepID=UPI00308D10EB|nr:DUF2306 domain-containing protein [Streptosporangium subroseum]
MTVKDTGTPAARGRPRKPWWQRPWIVPLALVTVVFLGLSVPPYTTLDPALARIEPRADLPWHYPVLVVHIFAGTLAMVAVCLQVWPWLRRNHPGIHRWSGRVYVMIGVPFVGIASLFIAPLSRAGFSVAVANTLWGILWLSFTLIGYRMVRRRRYAEHREWMLRSFAMIFAIITNRVWSIICVIAVMPQLETTYGGDENMLMLAAAPAASFLSWTVNLLFVEWWIQYRRHGGRKPGTQAVRPPLSSRPGPP